MENGTYKPEKKQQEKRSGHNRRKFSYGYQGHERRKGSGRRKQDKPPE